MSRGTFALDGILEQQPKIITLNSGASLTEIFLRECGKDDKGKSTGPFKAWGTVGEFLGGLPLGVRLHVQGFLSTRENKGYFNLEATIDGAQTIGYREMDNPVAQPSAPAPAVPDDDDIPF